jgi:hypothetical protein
MTVCGVCHGFEGPLQYRPKWWCNAGVCRFTSIPDISQLEFLRFSGSAGSDHVMAVWPIKSLSFCLCLLILLTKHPVLFPVEIWNGLFNEKLQNRTDPFCVFEINANED